MRDTVSFCLAGLCVGLALTGCGGSDERFISTDAALAAFHQAGFRNLLVISQKKAAAQLARRLGGHLPPGFSVEKALDEDTVLSTASEHGWPALAATRFPSSAMAQQVYQRVANPEVLAKEFADARKSKLLPAGFAPDKVRTALVCNIVISSYNANRDPALDGRLDRAIALLRDKC